MVEQQATELQAGGLTFTVSFREVGATLRVLGPVGDREKELVRFDDFVDTPHYHVPADGPAIAFDVAANGEPLEWIVGQLRDHLADLLTEGGYAEVIPRVDAAAVSAQAGAIRQMLVDCVPEGYVRPPGQALQRATG
ncbi:MAG: hypothetical protein J2P57_02675 [Acidimicrobiaceae bacterium]|nr:hypothetical protein [Acidimicrobiaceae bacterium]